MSTASASTSGPRTLLLYRVLTVQLLCGVVQLLDQVSVELCSGRSTPFTMAIPVTNGPLGTRSSHVGGAKTRRADRRTVATGIESEAVLLSTCVSRVPVCEPRWSIRDSTPPSRSPGLFPYTAF